MMRSLLLSMLLATALAHATELAPTEAQKIDYILLSPELVARVTKAGVFRKGVWGGVTGRSSSTIPR